MFKRNKIIFVILMLLWLTLVIITVRLSFIKVDTDQLDKYAYQGNLTNGQQLLFGPFEKYFILEHCFVFGKAPIIWYFWAFQILFLVSVIFYCYGSVFLFRLQIRIKPIYVKIIYWFLALIFFVILIFFLFTLGSFLIGSQVHPACGTSIKDYDIQLRN